MKEVTQLEAFLKFAASAKDEMGLTTVGQALDEFHNSDILLLDNALLYLQMILYTVLWGSSNSLANNNNGTAVRPSKCFCYSFEGICS